MMMYNTNISTEQKLGKSRLIYEVIRYKLTLGFNDNIIISFLKGLWLHLSLFKVTAHKWNAETENGI